ncbi:MAG TPA: hypothetical protein VLJ44_11370 [Gaiellaceae bacterium]|nr:hypothetical protein [Gaiellaceae bacterium]
MNRLLMVGRWTQVVVAVLAWILLVPVVELVRAAAGRLGLAARSDASAPERAVGSRAPVAHAHPRRVA